MNKQCVICSKENYLFELRFEADETDAGEAFSTSVCGSCWEVIAAISRRSAPQKPPIRVYTESEVEEVAVGEYRLKNRAACPLCPECETELHLTTTGEHVCRDWLPGAPGLTRT